MQVVGELPLTKAEYVPEPAPQEAQPSEPGDLLKMEAQIREASNAAEARGDDPAKLTVGEFAQGPNLLPEKFKTPTGEADVEKLKTSTRQLDEAIQQKEELQKSIDDYVEKQKTFRNLPNTEKLKAQLEAVQAPPQGIAPQATLSLDEIKAKIAADLQRDAPGTVLDLVEIAVQERLKREIGPLKQDAEDRKLERQDRQLRENLSQLAQKDSRILNPVVFDAINAKLEANPELWNLKNPHKAAWLEVKEEMRLGEPSQAPAQPSRPATPILGGGTPPPPQSSASTVVNQENVRAAIRQVDWKDKAQVNNVEKALRQLVDEEHRRGF